MTISEGASGTVFQCWDDPNTVFLRSYPTYGHELRVTTERTRSRSIQAVEMCGCLGNELSHSEGALSRSSALPRQREEAPEKTRSTRWEEHSLWERLWSPEELEEVRAESEVLDRCQFLLFWHFLQLVLDSSERYLWKQNTELLLYSTDHHKDSSAPLYKQVTYLSPSLLSIISAVALTQCSCSLVNNTRSINMTTFWLCIVWKIQSDKNYVHVKDKTFLCEHELALIQNLFNSTFLYECIQL